MRVTFHPAAEIELYCITKTNGAGWAARSCKPSRRRWMKFTKTRWQVRGSGVSCEANGCGGSPIQLCTPQRMGISGFLPSPIKTADHSTG